MTCQRALLGFVGCLGIAASLECTRSAKSLPKGPDEILLSRIGTGAAQTARVCARGATDRFATALCDTSRPAIRSLGDLYRAARLDWPAARMTATAVHSLGLSGRTVSALNPRVLVFQNISDKSRRPTYDQVAVAGFTRGEQFVELAALDPTTYEYNFYLLLFEQPCNRTRCTPEDLLTERIESGWTGWTLYSEHDLEDTPLDCVSCHQPFGPGTHKQLLMRQSTDPWMHWGDFRGGDERALCPLQPADGSAGQTVAVAEGLDLLRRVEGAGGRYAGIPVAELHAAQSGEVLSTFLTDAEGLVRLSPYGARTNYSYGQLEFGTREVLCERFRSGTSPSWNRYRLESRERGLPVPYYVPDVVDPNRRAEVVADRWAFLQKHASEDAFQVASSFLAPQVSAAVGFLPGPDDAAPEILRSMCLRCHSSATDPHLRRARFNSESIDRIDPPTANAIRKRLSLPKSSPELMPPLRVGELPPWAMARVERYLRDSCSKPGACN